MHIRTGSMEKAFASPAELLWWQEDILISEVCTATATFKVGYLLMSWIMCMDVPMYYLIQDRVLMEQWHRGCERGVRYCLQVFLLILISWKAYVATRISKEGGVFHSYGWKVGDGKICPYWSLAINYFRENRWHLGFCNNSYLPTRRGFDSFYGYFSHGEDYFEHTEEKHNLYDFFDNEETDYSARGKYSTVNLN